MNLFNKAAYDKFYMLMVKKEEFMLLVFANLIFQSILTFYFMEKTTIPFTTFQQILLYSIIIIIFIIIVYIQTYPIIKFMLFSLFSILMGVILSIFKVIINHELLQRTIMVLTSLFIICFIIGLIIHISGIKLSFNFGITLFYLLLILIIFDHLSVLIKSQIHIIYKLIALFALIITSLYIIYDTYIILQKNYNGDFITASLDYYIDIFFYFDYFTIGIRYLLYILNFIMAYMGLKQLKKNT